MWPATAEVANSSFGRHQAGFFGAHGTMAKQLHEFS
jgi:hypothetical protein